MKFEEALKKIENGGVITTPDKDKDGSAIMIHNYKGKYYSRYGNEINTDNQYLSGISTWEVSSKNFSDVLIDIMHQFIAGETMNVMDYTRCALNQTFLDFDRDAFNSQINRQLFIVNTSYESYSKNVITILSFINHALIRHVYDHIYVFVKDEWLYKDTAKKLPYSGVFEVNENNFNITFIFVRESASCVGWIDNVFEIKQDCRILRIYDQRVTEGISREDLVQGYFSSQQDHDDCLYFLSSDINFFIAATATCTALSVSWTSGFGNPTAARSWFATTRKQAPTLTLRYDPTINKAADSISDARHPIFFHASHLSASSYPTGILCGECCP